MPSVIDRITLAEVARLDGLSYSGAKVLKPWRESYEFNALHCPEPFREFWLRLGRYADHLIKGGKPMNVEDV